MPSKGILVAFVGLTCLALGQAVVSGEEKLPPDVAQALQRAAQSIEEARSQGALWTTAQEALERAKAAAERGDVGAALSAARFASEQAELGLAQRRYPRFDE
jgi:hypothetical protein